MSFALDHVVMGVGDLDAGSQWFQRLGFVVQPGGRHPGRGTCNAIVRFSPEYIELMSLFDEQEARSSGGGRDLLADFITTHTGGFLGYALETSDIDDSARRLRVAGFRFEGPTDRSRVMPSGQSLEWKILTIEGTGWRRPWPLVIQWSTPIAVRLGWEPSGEHENGVESISHIRVAVTDLEATLALYMNGLGLVPSPVCELASLGAKVATITIGRASVELLTPTGPGIVDTVLTEMGEGPFQMRVRSASVSQTEQVLRSHRVEYRILGGELVIAVSEVPGVEMSVGGRTLGDSGSAANEALG